MIKPMTKKELAEVAGYTYRRLHDIDMELPEGKKLFVKTSEGKYDLPLFVKHWVEFCVDRESVDADDIDVVKARHEAVKIQKTELEVAKLRGQLVDVQDMKRLWGDIANTVMQNCLHLPAKIAPRVRMMENTEQIAEIVEEEVRAVLTNIAETPLPSYVTGEEDEEENNEDDDE